jgi:hypothetical protein
MADLLFQRRDLLDSPERGVHLEPGRDNWTAGGEPGVNRQISHPCILSMFRGQPDLGEAMPRHGACRLSAKPNKSTCRTAKPGGAGTVHSNTKETSGNE